MAQQTISSSMIHKHRFLETEREFENVYRLLSMLRLAGRFRFITSSDGLFIQKKEEGDGSWTSLLQLDMDGNLFIRGTITQNHTGFTDPGRY